MFTWDRFVERSHCFNASHKSVDVIDGIAVSPSPILGAGDAAVALYHLSTSPEFFTAFLMPPPGHFLSLKAS
jgi:hypothetical protein